MKSSPQNQNSEQSQNQRGKIFESAEKGRFKKTLYATLLLAYRPYFLRVSVCLLLGFIGRILMLMNTNLIGKWIDHGLNNTQYYLTIMFSLCILGFIFIWIFRVVFSRLSAMAVSQIYDETTWRTSRYPMRFFDTNPTGRIVTRFSSDYGNVFRLFGGPIAEFFSIIFDLIAMAVLAAIAQPLFLVVAFVIGFFNFLIFKFNQKKLRAFRRELSASRSPSIAHFAESAQGISLIRVFNKVPQFQNKFKELDQFFLRHKKQTYQVLTLYTFQMNLLTCLVLLFTGFSSLFLVQKKIISIGDVGIIFTFITLSGHTIQTFFDWLSQLEEALIGVERLDQYLRLPLEPGSLIPKATQFSGTHPSFFYAREAPTSRTDAHSVNAMIQVKNLRFRYDKEQPVVLKNISFQLHAGEKLGIIGRTGSGKSSIIQAFFHLYPIESGEILINGLQPCVRPEQSAQPDFIDLDQFRKMITYIPQESTLFRGSLRQNLDLEGVSTDQEILLALQKVGLHQLLEVNQNNLDFFIEEKGKNLSLGEKQLLCLARASLRHSPVVILDEATSSVDPQTEESLDVALDTIFQGKTQIIIAHRLSTLKKCDRILWLHNGEIIALGKTEEVLQKFKTSDLAGLDLKGGI